MLFLSIFALSMVFTPSSVKADSNYAPGTLLKIKGVRGAAVYQIGSDGKKYVYPDQKTFNTWHDDFSEVLEVVLSELDNIDDGGTVTFQPGTRLLTHRNTAKVYAVGEDGELVYIPDEETARKFYGDTWNQLVLDIDPGLFAVSYKIRQGMLSDNNLPEGSLVEEEDTGEYFLIQDGQRRRIMADALRLRNLIRKHIIKLKRLSDLYDDGDSVDSDDDVEDFDIGKGTEKVIICHKPDVANVSIRVSERALRAHLAHGDYRGECSGDNNDDDNNDDDNSTVTDIKVSDIVLNPTSPVENATTTITAYIKNSGNVSLTDYEPIFDISKSLEDFEITGTSTSTISSANPLDSGESASIVWTGYFTSFGEKTLSVTTDNANTLDESDETNNTRTEDVTVLSEDNVDITVSDIVLDPTSPVENATTTITAYIKNSGDVSLTNYEPIFDVLVSLEDFQVTDTSTSTISITSPLDADEEASIVWTGYFDSDGQKRLSVTTDDGDTLDESDEGNNNILEYVTVIKNVAS